MSGFIGADPGRLDTLGESLKTHAGGLEDLRSALTAQLFTSDWIGEDAETARSDGERGHASPCVWPTGEPAP